jgi:hypothetical protein
MPTREAVTVTPECLKISSTLVMQHRTFGLSPECVTAIIHSAVQGNGPAQYIVATWCQELGFGFEAECWFKQPACAKHRAKIASKKDCICK